MHGASVQLHELPDDGQAQTEAALLPRRDFIGLTEALEHVWQKVSTDTPARVDNLHFHL
jgi:hypothetical protein